MEFIPVAGPSISQKEIDYVAEAAQNAWYGNATVYATRFEQAFAAYVGREHALAVTNCTSALHLALLAAGIGPGDEVIVPESTFIASAAPVTYVGATPIFADIETRSWCLDAESFLAKITPRTKALIVVDLYGAAADWDALEAAAAAHGIVVIEDAAQSIGGAYKGRKVGSFGLASTLSFGGTKALTTGEGGMLFSDDEEFIRRARFVSDHGRQLGARTDGRRHGHYHTEIAHNYRMSSLQAAFGLAQLERIDELLALKREIFEFYRREFETMPGLRYNPEPEGVDHSYWMVNVIPDRELGIDKERLMSRMLDEYNIATRPFYDPLSSVPAYAHLPSAETGRRDNPVAYELGATGINLPSSYRLDEEKIAYICDSLKACLTTDRAALLA